MTSSGVIPRPEDRQPQRYIQTGAMDAGDGHIIFGAEARCVVIMCDRGDIVLTIADQDVFARQLFRAIDRAQAADTEVPF